MTSGNKARFLTLGPSIVTWNYGSTPVLKMRTITALQISSYLKENEEYLDISSIVEKLNFCPTHIFLKIPSVLKYKLGPLDFSIFRPVNNFKTINVQYPHGNEFHSHREFCIRLILSASKILEELQLERLESNISLDFPSLGGTYFPKLTRLKVNNFFDEDGLAKIIGHEMT